MLCHTWRKKLSKLRSFGRQYRSPQNCLFTVVFYIQNCAVHSGNSTDSSVYLPTPRWHHLKAHPFLAIHSADQHRMIYSFSNTTSYSTFYDFFSSFRVTLWPMWLANSKRQPCFYPPQSHTHKKTHRTDKKTDKPDGKPVLCQRTFSSDFGAVFTQLNCTV